MLRLVRVTKEDVDVLFELVALSQETSQKAYLLAGLSQLQDHFKQHQSEQTVRMVLTHDLHNSLYDIVVEPFTPADADRKGIPTAHYLWMCAKIPEIQKNVAAPELLDPNFLGFQQEPQKTYLN